MWITTEIEAGGVKKEIQVKLLTVKEFFQVRAYAEQLEKSDTLTETEFLDALRGIGNYIKGINPEDEPMVFTMAAIKKLIEANTLSYEDFKKKSETKSQRDGQKK